MPDTVRTDTEILALLADNTEGAISPQDVRDAYVTQRSGRTWINTAWSAADISTAIQTGGRIHFAAGTYDISSLMTTSIITPSLVANNAFWLSGDGPEHTVLDGAYVNTDPTTGPLAFIAINATYAIFEGMKFKRITNVAAVADGTGRTGASSTIYRYEDWRANWLSKDIELIMFVNCAFEDCRRAFGSAMQNEGWLLKKFVFQDCYFDGGWGGVIMSGSGYQQIRILNNTFRNIDGTPAGYTTGGSPITNFSSRAVMIGMNRESASEAQFASNHDWQVGRNYIHTVTDTRTHATTKPEVHGTDLRCANYVHCYGNYVAEITSAEVDECEAYYHRDLWYQSSLFETAYNGGTKESSWNSKGAQEFAYVEGLHISCSDAYRAINGCGGLVFTGRYGTFRDCTLINIGRIDATDRGVVTFNGGNQTDIVLDNLQLRKCRTRHGIDIACGTTIPGYMTIKGGLISGQNVDAAGDPTSTASGIIKRDSADMHLIIDGVEFENFATPTNQDQRAIRLLAGAEGDVVIRNCRLRRPNMRCDGVTWTLSAAGTSEYYAVANSVYAEFYRPKRVFENGVAIPSGTLGALSAGQWAWGNNDALAANTLYVRLSDSADPDSKAEGYLRTTTFSQGIVLEGTWTNLRVDIINNDLQGVTEANALVEGGAPPTALRIEGNMNLGAVARTEAATDATPSVLGMSLLQVNHSAPTTMTALDDGIAGQTVLVKFGSANTTVDFTGTTLKGNVGADWTPASGDAMRCTFDGTNWYCAIVDATA